MNERMVQTLWAEHLTVIANQSGNKEDHWKAMDLHREVARLSRDEGDENAYQEHIEKSYQHNEMAGTMAIRSWESKNSYEHLQPTDEFLESLGMAVDVWPPRAK